jgi:glycosyltransferase involved in cell wall biosynthesis
MKLTILVPIFNEERTITQVVEKLQSLSVPDKEIILIDDGSTDKTREILPLFKADNVKIVLHEYNQGKGKAIQTGLNNAAGDIVAIQDADLEYDPEEIVKLAGMFDQDNTIDAVYGSRFLKNNPTQYKLFLLGNKCITLLTNILYGTEYTDTYTCYKVMKRDVMMQLNLESKRFEIEAEFSAKLANGKYKVVEAPINYNPRTIQEGKKIGFMDAVKGALTLVRYLK